MTRPKRTFAPLVLALVLAPTVFAACSSSGAAPIPSGAALTCADQVPTKNSPRLTLSTTDPVTPPWWGGDPNVETSNMPAGGSGWTAGNPYEMEGFEAGIAYSISNAMGYESNEIDWVKSTTSEALGPGNKSFDFFIAQVATRMATDAVDLSDSYYSTPEAVVSVTGRSITNANSVTALKTYRLGAVAGSAGESLVATVLQPSVAVTAFPNLQEAVTGLGNGTVDGLVVNAEVAFFLRDGFREDDIAAPVTNAVIVGRFAPSVWSDDFVVVLQRSSPLTACVNEAVDEIRRQGLIDEYVSEDLINTDGIPSLQ